MAWSPRELHNSAAEARAADARSRADRPEGAGRQERAPEPVRPGGRRARARRRPEVSPWTLGELSLRELATRVWHEISVDEISDRAAALAYYFLFALFPTLLFMTALIGLLPVGNLMDRLLGYARDVLPGDAASMLRRTLAEVQGGARGGLLSVGAAAALWGASRGMGSIVASLNVVYEVRQPRPWWRQQIVSIVLTITFSVLTLAALLSLVFGERIGRALAASAGLGGSFTTTWNLVQWPLALLFVLLGIDLVYHLAPAIRQRWYWLTPGSTFTLSAWLLASLCLRFYVGHFADYTATYGSIGGVILLLLWFYVAGLALLVGGEVNSVIAKAAAEHGKRIAEPLEGVEEGETLQAAG
jgi:membrane protein